MVIKPALFHLYVIACRMIGAITHAQDQPRIHFLFPLFKMRAKITGEVRCPEEMFHIDGIPPTGIDFLNMGPQPFEGLRSFRY